MCAGKVGARHRLAWPAWLWLLTAALLMLVAGGMRTAYGQDAECAEVKIVIEQKLSLERQAFDARMVIRNGLQTSSLSNVKIELIFKDQDQQVVAATTDPNAVGATFFVRTDSLSGLAALDGSSSIAPNTTADIRWLLIPSQGAGGATPQGRLYYIGARVTYTIEGQTSTVDVTPDYVVVRPQPLLRLDYFLPTDVYADDPFTPELEVAEPFTLGVRIANVGAGAAAKTQIESAQPKIVENRQGLLIDFKILGGYVGNDLVGKSLLLDFGDIAPQTVKMGRWLMETTLAGRFTEFGASFVHADSLGGAVTSLIKEVVTHKLVRDVRIDLPGHDTIDDFLAEAGNGYRVYDSQGGDTPAFDLSGSASLTSVAGGLAMQFPPTQGLVHVKLADPWKGARKPVAVLRSDGKNLASQNFWLSRSRNADLSWSYFLHVFDSNTTGQYTLVFSESTSAGLSGSVYRDSNGNGVRDTGELPEGNLGVILKGVDAQGRNVQIQTYTDPQGAFAYRGLAAGRYQLEAAVSDGWIDGTWVAGSAGGKAVPGLISDIVLLTGTDASGYLLSKRKPTTDTGQTASADTSIAVQAGVYQLRSGQSTSITITAQNTGPSAAQSVAVQASVPAGLTLQGSAASLGAYDKGVWTLGGLNKDQSATLTLTVLADAVTDGGSRSIAMPVSIGSQTADPQADNNQARLSLLVQSSQTPVELTQTLVSQARVLLWTACPGAASADQAACAQQKALAAQAWLSTRATSVQTATSQAEWRLALRSGKYNMLWLSGGASDLDDTSIAEIRAAVRRGQTLVVDGAAGPGVAKLADVLGATLGNDPLGQDLGVTLQGSGGTQPVVGSAYALELQSAQAQGSYAASGKVAIAGGAVGHGQVLLLGFDLLGMAINPAQTLWHTYAEQQLQALAPVVRTSPALAGTGIPVKLTARNPATAAADKAVTLQMELPAEVQYRDAVPQPGTSSPALSWNWTLAPGQEQSVALELLMPAATLTTEVKSALLSAADQSRLAERSLALEVLGLDTLVPRVGQTLAAMTGTSSGATTLIAQARTAVTAAQDAQARNKWSEILEALIQAQALIDQLAAPPHAMPVAELQLDVARWIGLAEMRWAPDVVEPPAQVQAFAGAGQSATVNKAFGDTLQALVLDRLARPVPGVAVRFDLPAAGASATFASGGISVSATTNAQGIAVSQVLTANAVVGTYSASASVAGVATAATFALSNTADPAAALRLQPVDGQAQSIRVGQLYAKPLSVRVLNGQNQPQAGAVVRFELPQTAVTGRFETAQGASLQSVQVTTGSDGLAVSPVIRAGAQAGSFQALASLVGASVAAVPFDLTNLAAPAPTPVFSGTTATGSGVVTASVSGGGPNCAFNPDATKLLPAQGMGAVLGRILLPHGVFDFELVSCTPGSEVTISTTWPDLRGITGYLKYGVTPISGGKKVWYPPLGLNISGNTVTYTIKDGGWGDDDLQANGVIKDPGGPVVMAAGAGEVASIPTLENWALVVLALVLAGIAYRREKHGSWPRNWRNGR